MISYMKSMKKEENTKQTRSMPEYDREKVLRERASAAGALGVPALYALALKKTIEGRASPREAIKAKCHECVGYEDVKERISGCTVKRCPLLAYRPYQSKKESTTQE